MSTPQTVIDFWRHAGPKRWFAKDDGFDATFRDTFHATHLQAARRELESWLDSAEGALALLILLDQYPRNAFRGTAHMFATDPLARLYVQRMVDAGLDQQVGAGIARVLLFAVRTLGRPKGPATLPDPQSAAGCQHLPLGQGARADHRALRALSPSQCGAGQGHHG